MKRDTFWILLTVAATSAMFAAPATAQDPVQPRSGDTVLSHLQRGLKEGIGRLAARFWEPRLNGYKDRVDAIFTGADRVQLNELRVRLAILQGKSVVEDEERRRKRDEQRQKEKPPRPVKELKYESDLPQADPMADKLKDRAAWKKYEAEQKEAAREREMAEAEGALATGEAPRTSKYRVAGDFQSLFELPVVARWLTRDHRAGLDSLADIALNHIAQFADTLEGYLAQYAAAHVDELARYRDLERMVESYGEQVLEIRGLVRHPLLFRTLYADKAEPSVLLYGGAGIGRFMGGAFGFFPVEIRSTSMLGRNTPAPASGTTILPYTLPEASSQTAIRIFNNRGENVLEQNEGAKGAGSHTATVDLSKLPPGWYLYQLTAQLPGGRRISEEAMRVAR